MQMYTGTRLKTAIHRRILSQFFLREWGRLYTGYGFTVCCNPENVLQCDVPTSPLYYDHLVLIQVALHFLFT